MKNETTALQKRLAAAEVARNNLEKRQKKDHENLLLQKADWQAKQKHVEAEVAALNRSLSDKEEEAEQLRRRVLELEDQLKEAADSTQQRRDAVRHFITTISDKVDNSMIKAWGEDQKHYRKQLWKWAKEQGYSKA